MDTSDDIQDALPLVMWRVHGAASARAALDCNASTLPDLRWPTGRMCPECWGRCFRRGRFCWGPWETERQLAAAQVPEGFADAMPNHERIAELLHAWYGGVGHQVEKSCDTLEFSAQPHRRHSMSTPSHSLQARQARHLPSQIRISEESQVLLAAIGLARSCNTKESAKMSQAGQGIIPPWHVMVQGRLTACNGSMLEGTRPTGAIVALVARCPRLAGADGSSSNSAAPRAVVPVCSESSQH